MCKSRIFNEILKAVSEETEVPADCILSNKKDEDTVDARYILVHLLMQKRNKPCKYSKVYQQRHTYC